MFNFILSVFLCSFFTCYVQAKQDKPNIVWLVSEDNSASWLKLYHPDGVSMPTVEKLASSGIVFNNAFSCGVVCSVARSTIISGIYAPRTGAGYHRRIEPVPMPKGIKMFPYYLRQAGYYTTNCYKEDYNFQNKDKKGVWDKSSKRATYKDRKKRQPFFHVQNYKVTHESNLHFRNIKAPTKTLLSNVKSFDYHPDTEIFRYTKARYFDNHITLDQQLAHFIEQLEQDGVMDDTFIFYYGDHGGVLPRGKGYAYNSGQHVPMVVYVPKNWKHLAPVVKGSRIDGFVQFVDLSATVLNLAGVEIPEGIDGKPFLGAGVSLEALNQRNTAFGYADRFDEKHDLVRTIRKGDFLYMRSYQPFNFDGLHNDYRYKMLAYEEWLKLYRAGKLNAKQSQFFRSRLPEALYHLKADPDEVNNLANDPQYIKKLLEMREILQKQLKSMPDLSFIPEPIFLKEGINNPSAYGLQNKANIATLIDIADLSLKPFEEVKEQILQALNSERAFERYWGCITCSCFGAEARVLLEKIKELAEQDGNRLVRIRAAEYLGLHANIDPSFVIIDVLKQVEDPVEANLILNTAVLLKDLNLGYQLDFSDFNAQSWSAPKKSATRKYFFQQRLNYLTR